MGLPFWLAALSALVAYIAYSVHQQPAELLSSTESVVRDSGYPLETHRIQTEDGYILTAFRIPHGRGQEAGKSRPPFWLQHGLTGNSDQFVLLGPHSALAFLLADKGYDVWIGNSRGNRYSNEHIRYTTEDPEFWDYSIDQLGDYDIPAAISYVMNVTKEDRIFYAGHSMGTAMLMIALNLHPDLQSRIELVFGLAPAVFVSKTYSSVFIFLTKYLGPIMMKIFGPYPLLPDIFPKLQNWYSPYCSPERITRSICEGIYTLAGGQTTELDPEFLPAITGTSPSQISVKTCSQYGQFINTGEFKAFDYGEEGNLKKYGYPKPPAYHLKNITTPLAIMFSDNDSICTPSDEYKLCMNHGRVVEYYRVPLPSFAHFDFVYGKTAKDLLYNRIFDILKMGPKALERKAECVETRTL